MGAALAFYTLFSLAPILVLVLAIAGWFYGPQAAQGELFAQLRGLVGAQGAEAIQAVLAGARNKEEGRLATIVAGALLLFGATTVFAELKASLDAIWQVPPLTKGTVWDTIRTRLLSFGMVLVLAFLLMVSLVVSAALTLLEKFWGSYWTDAGIVLTVINMVISFVVIAALFGVIFKMLPRVKLSWHDVTIGAVGTAALFTIGKYAIGAYIGNSGVASSYGAAGSMIALLLWLGHHFHPLHALGDDLDDDDHGHAEQQAPHAPQPAPEQQADEHRRRVHAGETAGHPRGHHGADQRGDGQRCAHHQEAHLQRFELQEGDNAGGDHDQQRAEIRHQVQQAGHDGPRAGVFQADPAQRDPHQQRQRAIGHQQHQHVFLDGAVDVLQDVHGDLLFRQRRPGQLHELALEGVARQQQEEHQEDHHRRLADEAHHAHRTGPHPVHHRQRVRRRGGRGTARGAFFLGAGGGLLQLGGHVLDALQGARAAAVQMLGDQPRQLVAGGRQLVDDGLELALQLFHHHHRAAENGGGDQRGADHARNADAFEPAHQRAQRVGNQDAEQQRHEEITRPLQRPDKGHGRNHAQRQAARVDMDGNTGRFARNLAIGGNRLCVSPGKIDRLVHDDSQGKRRRAKVRAGRGDYLTCRSFFTAVTPLTPRATSPALAMSCGWATKPLSCTVPLKVSTLISVDFRVGSLKMLALTLVVMTESSTYSPVPSLVAVEAQPVMAPSSDTVNRAVAILCAIFMAISPWSN
ncbi:conserved hypothetical protein [Ricinus communis]|uniref:Uncharacterized protein n=1 Tax=Ricinus communis TaxID=3988 RepID=B9TB17_RICCO|nr:conserved hypothetical protein [Ricinus communis]